MGRALGAQNCWLKNSAQHQNSPHTQQDATVSIHVSIPSHHQKLPKRLLIVLSCGGLRFNGSHGCVSSRIIDPIGTNGVRKDYSTSRDPLDEPFVDQLMVL